MIGSAGLYGTCRSNIGWGVGECCGANPVLLSRNEVVMRALGSQTESVRILGITVPRWKKRKTESLWRDCRATAATKQRSIACTPSTIVIEKEGSEYNALRRHGAHLLLNERFAEGGVKKCDFYLHVKWRWKQKLCFSRHRGSLPPTSMESQQWNEAHVCI